VKAHRLARQVGGVLAARCTGDAAGEQARRPEEHCGTAKGVSACQIVSGPSTTVAAPHSNFVITFAQHQCTCCTHGGGPGPCSCRQPGNSPAPLKSSLID